MRLIISGEREEEAENESVAAGARGVECRKREKSAPSPVEKRVEHSSAAEDKNVRYLRK